MKWYVSGFKHLKESVRGVYILEYLTQIKSVLIVQELLAVAVRGGPETQWDCGRTPPSSLQSFPCQPLIQHLCADASLPHGPALSDSGRANQPRASALAPFPVSACRLPALSEGQLSAVRPTLPLQTTIKSPLFWAGREKWEETDAPYTKTRSHQSASKRHTEMLAVSPQISASQRDTWVRWHQHWLYFLSHSKPL